MDRARRLNERVGSGGRRRDRDYPWACFAALKPLSARTCGFESHALRTVRDQTRWFDHGSTFGPPQALFTSSARA